MTQKRIPRLTVAGAWVFIWNATFVAPEDVGLAPIHFIFVIAGEQLEEAGGRTAAIERNQEAVTLVEGLCCLLDKNLRRVLTELFGVFEDANI